MDKRVLKYGLVVSRKFMPIMENASLLLVCSSCGAITIIEAKVIPKLIDAAYKERPSASDMLSCYSGCCSNPHLCGQYVNVISLDNTPPQDVTTGNDN